MRTLDRCDVVGKTISLVFQSPEEKTLSDFGYPCVDASVRLTDGIVFAIRVGWSDTEIMEIKVDPLWRPAFGSAEASCNGEVIENVLFSDQWGPYLIILLSSNRVLTIADSPWTSGPALIPKANFVLNGAKDFWKRNSHLEKD